MENRGTLSKLRTEVYRRVTIKVSVKCRSGAKDIGYKNEKIINCWFFIQRHICTKRKRMFSKEEKHIFNCFDCSSFFSFFTVLNNICLLYTSTEQNDLVKIMSLLK